VACEFKPPATISMMGSDWLAALTLMLFPSITKGSSGLVLWVVYKGDAGRAVKVRLTSALSSHSLPSLSCSLCHSPTLVSTDPPTFISTTLPPLTVYPISRSTCPPSLPCAPGSPLVHRPPGQPQPWCHLVQYPNLQQQSQVSAAIVALNTILNADLYLGPQKRSVDATTTAVQPWRK